MLNLDTRLRIPPHVVSSTVAKTSVVLNTKTKKYYALDDVGLRFWDEIKRGSGLRKTYETILDEYEVPPSQLENDLLELVRHLVDTGLIEFDEE